MKFLLYILFFLCCYSGSLKNVNHTPDDRRLDAKSETILPETNISSNVLYFKYLIHDDTIYFDTPSDNDFSLNNIERRYQGHYLLAQKLFHQDHPFCFSKSTDPVLELDIPPPTCS